MTATGPDVTLVIVSIDGDDAMFIDYTLLFKNGNQVKNWGIDGGSGWCLSTDLDYSFSAALSDVQCKANCTFAM